MAGQTVTSVSGTLGLEALNVPVMLVLGGSSLELSLDLTSSLLFPGLCSLSRTPEPDFPGPPGHEPPVPQTSAP
jgi:hypothetical protein